MPSPAMQQLIDGFRDHRAARTGQAPPTLDERRATFAPAGRLHPVPDDVLVAAVTAGEVPAYWLDAPGIDSSQVLVFVHGGGFQLGSLRSHGELAARLGRASRMRVLIPEYRRPPSTRSLLPSTTSWPNGAGSAPAGTWARDQSRWPATRPAEGSPSLYSWPCVTRGRRCRRLPH
jgi:hypothetical protein